jgi:hypothetical protein
MKIVALFKQKIQLKALSLEGSCKSKSSRIKDNQEMD